MLQSTLRQTLLGMLMLVVFSSLYTSARGDTGLDFSADNGGTFSDTFNISSGDMLTIDVYLRETVGTDLVTTDGLLGFGLGGDLNSTSFGTISNTMIAATFDDSFTSDSSTSSRLEWSGLVGLFSSAPAGSLIRLGEFRFDSTSAGTTLIDFKDYDPTGGPQTDSWLSGMGTPLDEFIFDAGRDKTYALTINSTAVPEPASGLMGGAVLVFACLRRRRRRATT